MTSVDNNRELGEATESRGSEPKVSRRFLAKLIAVPVCMFGFGYLMVPLYDVFCDVTGLNGKTGAISFAEVSKLEASAGAEMREVKVQFVSSVNQSGLWEFKPTETSMMVQLGKAYTTSYLARNLTDRPAVSQSVPSVSPSKAASHFNKSVCFCFTEQAFTANESRDMALTFVVDPDLPEDVDAIVLSYTLFTKSRQGETQSFTLN